MPPSAYLEGQVYPSVQTGGSPSFLSQWLVRVCVSVSLSLSLVKSPGLPDRDIRLEAVSC